MRASAIVLAALPVMALGCNNGRISEQDDIRGTVQTFLEQCGEQRALHVLPALVPAAQKTVIDAATTLQGCGRVLRLPPGANPTPEDYAAAKVRVQTFDGGRSRVAVQIGATRTSVVLSRGTERWRIEGP